MRVEQNKVVSMHYKLADKDGVVIDNSEGRPPLAYIHGIGALVAGLEAQLENKVVGDKFQAIVAPEDAYGTRDEELVRVVPKSGFQGDEEMTIGMQVQIDTGDKGLAIATLTAIDGDDITLDLNHPLSDMELHFDIDIMDIREATSDEIAHGHVHGEGGHQH